MYSSQITTSTPSAFIFLVDQSGSMEEMTEYLGRSYTKAQVVAGSVNMIICELINRCRRETGYRDYFDVAALGYSGDGVKSLLPDAGNAFMSLGELAGKVRREKVVYKDRILPDGKIVTSVSRLKVWVEPYACGPTPMAEAMDKAAGLASEWCERHRGLNCFPPIVINITDGESSDADDSTIEKMADKIRAISSGDGNVLFFNTHITTDKDTAPVLFPSRESDLPDKKYANLLYRISSELPDIYHDAIHSVGGCGADGCSGHRAMSYNASLANLVSVLNIGTVSNLFTL